MPIFNDWFDSSSTSQIIQITPNSRRIFNLTDSGPPKLVKREAPAEMSPYCAGGDSKQSTRYDAVSTGRASTSAAPDEIGDDHEEHKPPAFEQRVSHYESH